MSQSTVTQVKRLQGRWPALEQTTDVPLEFKVLENQPTIDVAATNDFEFHLENTYEAARHWASNWNIPTNTSITISPAVIISNEPHIVYIYTRNVYSRPWLDELSKIQLPKIKFSGEPSATGLPFVTEPVANEEERPITPFRQSEMNWLSSNSKQLGKYEGKWIALEGDEIVASGSNEVTVEMQARMKGIKVPFLIRVPSKADKPFIGQSLNDSSSIR